MTNVLKLTKKIFTVGVVATTIVWSLGVAALVPGVANAATCPTLSAGDMVKVTGKAAIYAVDNNLKVRYFDNGDVFKSWRPTYGGYVSISMDCLDSLGIPSAAPYGVTYHAGSYIVKRASSDQLYVVEPNNTLAKITSALATTLYGTGYKVMTISDQDWPNYVNRGSDITEAKAHPGMLVKNGGKTWYVNAANQLQEVTETGMTANGFQTKFVRTVADSVVSGLSSGDAITAEVKALSDKTQSGGVTGTTTTGAVTVSLAANTPASATLPSGSLYSKVLNVNLAAGNTGATVTGLTLTRGGLIANTSISGISVWDGNTRLGNIMTSLTSDGKVTVLFGSGKVVLGANSSKTLSVALNFPTSTTAGTVNMSVASAADVKTETGITVGGTFPIVGNTFSLTDGTASLGNVYVDDVSVGGLTYSTITSATGNVEVGDTDKEVAKFSFVQNNSKEAIQLEQLTVYVEGTFQETTDLANWKLVSPEGNVLATTEKSSDRYVKFVLTSPYVIDKGLTKNFSVKVDVKDGSSRYFRVSVQNDYDVMVRGVTTGAYIAPLDGSGTTFTSSDTQNANGGFLIKQGALTVSKSSSSPSTKVAPGAQNVTLAKFDLKSNGEALEIRKMRLLVKYASGQKDLTGTLSVKDSTTGETYLSISADTSGLQSTSAPSAYTSLSEQNLSTYISLTSGQTRTIEVVGTIDSTATASDNYTVYVGDFYVKRMSTNDYTNLAQSVYTANQIGVNSVTVTVNKDVSFPNSTKAQGTTAIKIGQYTMKASSADDIKLNTIQVAVGGTSSTAAIQNLMLKNEADGSQLGSTIGSPSTNNSFTVSKTITKDATLVLGVYADLLSSVATNGTVSTSIPASGLSGYGIASNTNLDTVPSLAVIGQTITAGAATLTIKADANTVSSKIALAGKTGVEVLKLNLEATRENLTLKKLTLQVASASTTNWAVADIAANFANVYLYDGATLLASDKVESTNGTVTFTGLNVALNSDTQKVLTVKVDVSDSGTMTPKSVAKFQVYSTSTDYLEVYSTQGIMSSGVTLTSNGAGNYALYTVSAPTASWSGGSAATKLPSATDVIGQFTITNDGSRAITLTTTSVYLAVSGLGTGGQVSTLKLYDSDGNLVAASNNTVTITSSSANDTANFQMSTYNEIAAGGSKTYVVKADTSAIRTGLTSSQNAYLSVKLDGSKGYDSTEVATVSASTEEAYWNDGKIVYGYTNVSGGTTYTNLNASDANPVEGVTYTY